MYQHLDERIEQLKQQAIKAQAAQQKKAFQSRTARISRDVTSGQRFFFQLLVGLYWVWQWIVSPVWRIARKPMGWIIGRYVALWTLVVNVKDRYGSTEFSKRRAGLMIAGTFVFLFFVVGPLADLFLEGSLYLATGHVDETVILLSSQEVNSDRNVHNIEGCWTVECGDEQAVYFRAQWTPFNQLWNWAHGKGIFYPDYIAAAVPTGKHVCLISSYGFRWHALIRNFNLFPEILEIKYCHSLGNMIDGVMPDVPQKWWGIRPVMGD